MTGKFELYADKAGGFRFRLKAPSGVIILASEVFKRKSSVENVIESVRKNSQNLRMYDFRIRLGRISFNLKAKNGQVIGTSEKFTSEEARDHMVDVVRRTAPDATLEDLT